MKNFRTYELAFNFYQSCQKLKIQNTIIRDQFERAVLSIVLNISEGSGKERSNDKKKFYSIAMGSLRETQCLLRILNENNLYRQSDTLGASLYRLIQNPGGF